MNNEKKQNNKRPNTKLKNEQNKDKEIEQNKSEKTILSDTVCGQSQKYKIVFDLSPDAIILIDNKGVICELNNRIYDWLGYYPAEIKGKNLLDIPFFSEKNKAFILKKFSQRLTGDYIKPYDIEFITTDGIIKIGRIRGTVIKNESNYIVGTIILISDVTEMIEVENKLKEVRDKLEERVKERTRELHNINEELRREIAERKKIEIIQERLKAAIDQIHEAVIITDKEGTIQYANPAFETITGFTPQGATGKNFRILISDKHDRNFYTSLWNTISSGKVWSGKFTNNKKDGTLYHEELTISPVMDESGTIINYVAVKRDISQQLTLETQLRQAQMLESIGQLAAGIAHEINTPTQYVGDNTRFMKDTVNDIFTLLDTYKRLYNAVKTESLFPELTDELEKKIVDSDIDYLFEEIPNAIDQTLEGIDRVTKIVRAMKEFSNPGTEEKTAIDINRAIESTITVARNEWKYVAEMVTDFDPDLPLVPCHPGEFNQVILNIIINAAHAISNVVGDETQKKGTITIRTSKENNYVIIRISDTGTGIPEDIRTKIFDPFFTTKEVGKGSGQGLSISYNVIVEKHKGSITFDTETGKGTTFIICLPVSAH
ncbi:MAG: PAS domain S-box protein [Candidatus Latescibacteria bacterium]|nr:PAS domain S-box protein [Candidatus Latescibacterota bacterium]